MGLLRITLVFEHQRRETNHADVSLAAPTVCLDPMVALNRNDSPSQNNLDYQPLMGRILWVPRPSVNAPNLSFWRQKFPPFNDPGGVVEIPPQCFQSK